MLVGDEEGLHKLHSFFQREKEPGFDFETNIVPTFVHRKVRTLQFGNREEQYVVDLLKFAGTTEVLMDQGWRKPGRWVQPVLDVVKPVLESREWLKVGVNLAFEYETANWCLGLRPFWFWDCMETERMFYQGKVDYFAKGFWAMDDMVERYLRLKMNKELQKSFDLETPLTEDQLDYAALDTRLPKAIRVGQLRMAEKLKVERAVQIENDAIPAFSEMRLNGKKLSQERWLALVESIETEHVEHVKQLDKYFVPVVGLAAPPDVDLKALEERWRDEKDRVRRAEYLEEFREARRGVKKFDKDKDKYEGEAAVNYDAPEQLLSALQKMPGFKSLKGTSKKVLARFSDKPVIQAIQAFRKSAHALKSFGRNWFEYINPDTGRIHANHLQNGTETGRPSCVKPNLYNIPKDKRYRKCFVAEEGYSIITVDENGAELRIIAEMSGEESWIAAFSNNWDMHSLIASSMQGEKWTSAKGVNCRFEHDKNKCECPEHKTMRDGAKAINFGVAYGKEAYALAEDLKVAVETAQELLAIWRKANSKVQAFLTNSGNFAKMNLCARTFSGRVRFFEKPTWELAKKRALEDAEKFKRAPQARDVNKKYGAMFGSIEREGKNTPIQGGNADVTKTAMGAGYDKNGRPFMWHLLPDYDTYIVQIGDERVELRKGDVKEFDAILEVKTARLINHVYDEFVVECPTLTAQACMDMIGDCIRRAGAEFMTKVTMEYEGHIAECWTK
jgi:DNA polymerase I-like protein with 3'-5' exonuclease and polymerase domains